MIKPETRSDGEQPCSPELAQQVHDELLATLGAVGVAATAENPVTQEALFEQIPYELRQSLDMSDERYGEYTICLAPGNYSIPYQEADWPGGIGIGVEEFGDYHGGRGGQAATTYFEPGFEDDGTPTIRKNVYEIKKDSLVDRYFPQNCPVPVGGYQKAIAEAKSQLGSLEDSAALKEATRLNRATNDEARGLLDLLHSF